MLTLPGHAASGALLTSASCKAGGQLADRCTPLPPLQASPQELLAFLLSGSSEATSIAELAGQPIQLALRVAPPEGHSGGGAAPAAVMHATLPPAYPAEGCTCSVSSTLLPKQWQAQATDQAQQLVSAAGHAAPPQSTIPAGGCLHPASHRNLSN